MLRKKFRVVVNPTSDGRWKWSVRQRSGSILDGSRWYYPYAGPDRPLPHPDGEASTEELALQKAHEVLEVTKPLVKEYEDEKDLVLAGTTVEYYD